MGSCEMVSTKNGVPLHVLMSGLGLKLVRGDDRVVVTDLTDDSRQVRPSSLFVARCGTGDDGRRYIGDALARGAAVIISDRQPEGDGSAERAAWLSHEQVDQALAGELAERFFDRPGRRLNLIGVTGTNGKTTVSMICRHLLQHAGVRCGLMGTVYCDDGQQQQPAALTTPGAIDISRMLANMVANGCAAAVMEVSSHALDQRRTAALAFDAAVFTNLTGDHLDYHETMQQYASAKAKLFEPLGPDNWAVLNADDAYAVELAERCEAKLIHCTLGADREAEARHVCSAKVLELTAAGSGARFTGHWGSVELRLPLIGRHNVANALQAMAAASTVCALTRETCRSLEQLPPVPGRLEPVASDDEDAPTVLVDYAHTHDALANVLDALRPITPGRLIVLFGCGGDRDRTKRPKMAAEVCARSDHAIITSDNPRTEEPAAIIDDICAGVPAGASHQIEPDRARAIELAIGQAQRGDTVLLAGKGHEPYQQVGTQRHHFDDREQAAEVLRARMSGV